MPKPQSAVSDWTGRRTGSSASCTLPVGPNLYICTHIYTRAYTNVDTYMNAHFLVNLRNDKYIDMYIYIYTHTYAYTHTHMSTAHTQTHTYVYGCVYTYICIHVYLLVLSLHKH